MMHCLSDASLNETLYGESAGQGEVTVIKRTVFFVSDQTGITAETMGHSLMTQFDGIEFRQVTVPFISTVDKA
ncbi:MAG TPA: kinase/pyrophosphorylase, partial [Xanthobacteraceae bacterium]|nr:kinase/pyrophosphorylase [Xanthobacteraceae bacterium]